MVVVFTKSLFTILGIGFRLCEGIEEKQRRVSESDGDFEA